MNGSGRPKILCVDDEPLLLELFVDVLCRQFNVTTAESGVEALALIGDQAADEPFEVIVSDMRMPVMNGALFLALAREREPDSVRVLLTGQADIDNAAAAVNDGQIFRFLTKPCAPARLVSALTEAASQHRLLSAERVLLEQTLRGAIRTLVDLLALAAPTAFGRATRIKNHALLISRDTELEDSWKLETAALLSQIGCLSLPPEILAKTADGSPLTQAEQATLDRLPEETAKLLRQIPRMEEIVEIIRRQNEPFANDGALITEATRAAQMLRIASDFDLLETQDMTLDVALDTMRSRGGRYDRDLLERFAFQLGNEQKGTRIKEIWLSELVLGMTFAEDVRSSAGIMLIARGHDATESLIERIWAFPEGHVAEPLVVSIAARGDAATTDPGTDADASA